MHVVSRVCLVVFAGTVMLGGPAWAQWTNGQNAAYVIGQSDFTSNGTATSQTGLGLPYGVTLDLANNKLYVADYGNNRVLRFAYPITSNQPSAEAVLGQADFVSHDANRGGSAAANTMASPMGVTVDSAGRLWVADYDNNRVLRFDSAATKANGASADAVLGQADFTSSSFATTQAGMYWPAGVVTDSSGRLWVADYSNNRVLRFDNAAAKANGGNADGVLGQADFTSRVNATTQSGMRYPFGVAVDGSGRLWVTDQNNSRMLRFDGAASKSNGANADGVLGQTDFTSNSTGLSQSKTDFPGGLALDNSGRLYVADLYNHRVLLFDNAAGKSNGANADNVLGQTDFVSNSSATTQSGMYYPICVCADSTNNRLFVVDNANSRVLQFNASGALPVELGVFGVE